MYSVTSGAYPTNNELDMPASPLRVQGESLESCPKPALISSYLHKSATIRSLSVTTSVRVIHPDAEPGWSYSTSRRPQPL